MKKIKIVIADGSNLFVDALKLVLEKEPEVALLSGVNSGVDALRNCIDVQPDVAVIGEVLPDLTIVELAKEIRRSVRGIRFLFIIRDGSADMLSLLSSMDSVGAVRQSCDIPEFLTALRSVIKGERYISTEVIEYLKNPYSDDMISDDLLNDITQREREVLYWVSHGLTNKEISEMIFLSEKTVKNHVSHILKKLDLSDRTKAAAFAWQDGLPLLPEDFFTPPKMN
ncbi:MAG: response regulator transcription factor [Synergistaceae bacterium]|nr:response regulator transcription factor [Synergistaceae bacterium]